jgi:hypothetical protein
MDECICFVIPEHMWTQYGSAVEPGSQMEWNPECPVHPPESDRPVIGSEGMT